MPAAAWMTIAVAGLIIVVTAVGLIRIVFHLRAVRTALAAVAGGVQVVDQLTATVPARLTRGGYEVGWNNELSAGDKSFIRRMYPDERSAQATAPYSGVT